MLNRQLLLQRLWLCLASCTRLGNIDVSYFLIDSRKYRKGWDSQSTLLAS